MPINRNIMSGEVEQMRVLPSLVVVLTLHSVCFASGLYRLRVLAKEGDTIGGLTLTDLLPPSINNSGTVVFGAKYSQCRSSFCGAIFMDSSVLVKPGDTIDGFTLADMPRSPVISDNGTVAFLGLYAGCGGFCFGIFTPSAALVKAEDYSIDRIPLREIDSFSLSSGKGTLVFAGRYPGCGGTCFAVFTKAGMVVKTGDTVGGLSTRFVGAPVINDDGVIAFRASYSMIDQDLGIFTPSGLIVKRGDIVDGLTLRLIGFHGIDTTGKVTFEASYSEADGRSANGIFTPEGLLVKRGDAVDGLTIESIIGYPAVAGSVAFVAQYRSGSNSGAGVFTSTGVVARSGDSVGGLLLSGAGSPLSINDSDTVAFLGALSDESSRRIMKAIVVAENPARMLSHLIHLVRSLSLPEQVQGELTNRLQQMDPMLESDVPEERAATCSQLKGAADLMLALPESIVTKDQIDKLFGVARPLGSVLGCPLA